MNKMENKRNRAIRKGKDELKVELLKGSGSNKIKICRTKQNY